MLTVFTQADKERLQNLCNLELNGRYLKTVLIADQNTNMSLNTHGIVTGVGFRRTKNGVLLNISFISDSGVERSKASRLSIYPSDDNSTTFIELFDASVNIFVRGHGVLFSKLYS